MTGADFQAVAYALIRPNGPAWLAAWQAGDAWAADELSEWELEGHPFHHTSWSTTDMMTVTIADVLDGMQAIYAVPGTWTRKASARDVVGNHVSPTDPTAVAWDLCAALDRAAAGHVAAADAAEHVLLALAPHSIGLAGLNDEPSFTHTDLVALLQDARHLWA